MQKHTKKYFDYFGYGIDDVIDCEVCGNKAVDIHHIHPKKMGGHKTYDHNGKTYDIEGIENLIALCRKCHIEADKGTEDKETFILVHKYKMANK